MSAPRPFALTIAGLAAAALLALASAAAQAERVDTVAALGVPVATKVASAGDVASIGFLVQDGAAKKVSIQVKPAKKSPLKLDVKLISPAGVVVDPLTLPGGKVKATAAGTTITFNDVPVGLDGLWRVEVRGANGTTGDASVTVKAKDVTSLTGGITVPAAGTASVPIEIGSNQTLTLTLKRGKGAQITPRVKILAPNGIALDDGAFLGTASSKTGTLTLKAYRLPTFGQYTLQISGENNGGGAVTYVAKTAAAKPAKGGPVANAGAATDAEPSMTKQLDGSASTGTALRYLWSQVAGPAVELSGSDTANPSFVAPDSDASLGFELAVQQGGVWSAPAAVTVEVGTRPLADAGRSVAVPTATNVTLDGSKSRDRRGSGLRYSWRQHPDDTVRVTLTGADTVAPTFASPGAPAILRFGLTADDGSLRSAEDYVTVRVGDTDQATADAGRVQVVRRMATVHLSGLATRTGSGALDVPLSWTQVSGTAVTLDNSASPFPAFTAPKQNADLAFELRAAGNAASDIVWVYVRADETNTAPVTRGNGAQFAVSGNVTIAATSSTDIDGDTLDVRWGQLSGPALAPADASAASTTVPLPAGNASRVYAAQAHDGLAYGPPDLVPVRNTGYTGLPVAAAGNDLITNAGVAVNLDGRGSSRTSGSGPLTYRWRQVSARDWFDVDAVVATFDPTAANPTFVLPTDLSSLASRRTMTFELIVNDGTQDSAPDTVNVTFQNLPLNGKPTVTAGASTTNPIAGQQVTLQGTKTDRDGDPVTVRWTQKAGATVALTGGATSLTPSFTAPATGTLTFELVGNDGIENSAPASVTIVVDAAPTAVLNVTPNSGAAGTAATISATSSSDPEGRPLTYTLTQISGATVPVTAGATAGVWTCNPANSATWQLTVSDGRQSSQPVTAGFTVGVPVTVAPTSSTSSAPYGASVTITANATGGPTTYTWTQLTTGANASDPVATIANPSAASTTFTVPKPTSSTGFGGSSTALPGATFRVTASNGSSSDAKTVRVTFYASFNSSSVSSSDTVYGIIASNCTSCHTGTRNSCPMSNNAANYGMGTASGFMTNSVGATSCSSSKSRIAAGNSGNSYLVDRIKGIGGSQMGSLSGAQIALIEDWIAQGAQNN